MPINPNGGCQHFGKVGLCPNCGTIVKAEDYESVEDDE